MTPYSHHFVDGTAFPFPLGKIVCVGRNYAEHARELNNPVPTTPLLFIKPATAAVALETPIRLPRDRGEVHFETELAVLIGRQLQDARPEDVADAIAGYGLALDLTLREVQSRLKEKGHPWEIAKSFDGACPLSAFVPPGQMPPLGEDLDFSLEIDGTPRQQGHSRDMLNPIAPLIAHMSGHFTLNPGDVILTGTPQGVGPLQPGQKLRLRLGAVLEISTEVIQNQDAH